MEFAEAKKLIRDKAGYRVEFEKINGGILESDHFPDHEEETIPTEEEAWDWAKKFAKDGMADGIVNVYVIHGDDFTPVDGYEQREFNIYPLGGDNE